MLSRDGKAAAARMKEHLLNVQMGVHGG
jgi:hypothetical protein